MGEGLILFYFFNRMICGDEMRFEFLYIYE